MLNLYNACLANDNSASTQGVACTLTDLCNSKPLNAMVQLLNYYHFYRKRRSFAVYTRSISFSNFPYLSEIKNIKNGGYSCLDISGALQCTLKVYEVYKKDCCKPCLLAMNQAFRSPADMLANVDFFSPMERNKAYVSITRKNFITVLILDSHT